MTMRFNDLLINILLFIFVAAFPVNLIPVGELYQCVISLFLRLLLLTFYIYIIIRNRRKVFGLANFKNLLFCIPLFIVCFSNAIATKISGNIVPTNMSVSLFIVYALLALLTAINEEIVFRFFIQNSLTNCGSIKRIFASAAIFSLMHLLNLVNVSTVDALVSVLIQVVYNFGLGILLGIVYEYGHSLLACVILHFSFNFFNDVLFVRFLGYQPTTLSFYLTAGVIAIILGIYIVIMYNVYFKKIDNYFRN